MRKTMAGVLRYAAGRDVILENLNPDEGVGSSLLEKVKGVLRAIIWVALGFLFPAGMSDAEKEIILYGVGVHEVLHILRTDFAYAAKQMETFPAFERRARHTFANILEDAAIEYLRSDRLSEFMHKALTASIGFFHRIGPSLGEQDSAWAELITALIQFGDVGVLKGSFKFPEAEQAFLKCLHPYQEGITEPNFKRRFALSQEMFEICRPLWEEYMKNALAESAMKSLLQSLGKNLFSEKGQKGQSPQEDGKPASSAGPSEANERRRKTIHLIDEAQAEEMRRNVQEGSEAQDPSEATDVYVTVGESGDENGSGDSGAGAGGSSELKPEDLGISENDDVEVVDERKNKQPSESASESDGNGSKGGSSESGSESDSGETEADGEGSEDSSACGSGSDSEGSGSESSGSSSGKASGETLTKEDVLKNVSFSEDGSGSASKPESAGEGQSESEGVSDAGETSETSASRAGEAPDAGGRKDLGQELRELSKALSEELAASGELEISEDFSREMEESMESEIERERRVEALLEKKGKAEAIDVTVESPYYKDVEYVNVECFNPDPRAYAEIETPEIKRYALNLRSSFKKIFAFKNGRKEYRTNGRIDVERFSGKKLTARMFYRNSKPADKSDMAMVIFVDQSGSMRGSMDRVKQTLAVLLDALRGFDVKVKVVGFTTNGPVTYFHYGNRKWENDEKLAMCCMRMNASGGTFLGHALRYTGAMLKNRPERNKIYVCITDGDPSYSVYDSYSAGMNDCRQAVNEVRKFADVIGIGLYYDEESEDVFKYVFRDSCASMSSLDGLVRELPRRLKKILAE